MGKCRDAHSAAREPHLMGSNEVVRPALRLSRQREAARAAFVRLLEDATAEGMRDGFRTEHQVEASVMAVIAEIREREG